MHVHGCMWTETGIPTKSAEERSCLDHKTSGFKLAVPTTEKIEWGRRTTDSLASPQKTLKCFATKSSGILHRTIGHSDLEEERRAWKPPTQSQRNPQLFVETRNRDLRKQNTQQVILPRGSRLKDGHQRHGSIATCMHGTRGKTKTQSKDAENLEKQTKRNICLEEEETERAMGYLENQTADFTRLPSNYSPHHIWLASANPLHREIARRWPQNTTAGGSKGASGRSPAATSSSSSSSSSRFGKREKRWRTVHSRRPDCCGPRRPPAPVGPTRVRRVLETATSPRRVS